MASHLIFLLTWYAYALQFGHSLKCYECAHQGSQQDDCTTRECVGEWCLITIATDTDGTQLTSKNCASTQPKEYNTSNLYGSCKKIANDGIVYTICACNNQDYCNTQPTIARILSEPELNQATSNSFSTDEKTTRCRLCSASSCRTDAAVLCEEQWCTAQIVFDKFTYATTVNKNCSNQPHDEKISGGCSYLETPSSAITTCSCNDDYCTDDGPLLDLIKKHSIVTPELGGGTISTFLNESGLRVTPEIMPPDNFASTTLAITERAETDDATTQELATQAFLGAENVTTSTATSFSISFPIVFLILWISLLS